MAHTEKIKTIEQGYAAVGEKIAAEQERRRIVGLVLAEYAHYKLAGKLEIAAALDSLATQIENLAR